MTPRGPRKRPAPELFRRPDESAADPSAADPWNYEPPNTADAARAATEALGWNGLCGTLELTVLSGSLLGVKDTDDNRATKALSKFGGNSLLAKVEQKFKGKTGLPASEVVAWVPSQAPPNKPDCRKTPKLTIRSANPVWNCTWYYTVEYSAQDDPPADIRLEVWDTAAASPLYLGELSVPFPRLPGHYQHQARLRCNRAKMADPGQFLTGSLSVQLRWKSDTIQDYDEHPRILSVDPAASSSVCGKFGISCIRAVDLRIADLISSDPYCVIHVGVAPRQHHTCRTGTLMGTTSPEWNELHEMHINWPKMELDEKAQVNVEFWDYDKSSSDEFLGEITFPLPTEGGDQVIDAELRANRAKGSGVAQGRCQVRVYFRQEFRNAIEAEPELTPYEEAFCHYFGTRAVDEQMARALAPYLVYFHLSAARLLRGQLRRAWHRATCGLTDPGPAFPRGFRVRGYCALTSWLWSSLALGSLFLLAPVDRLGGSALGAAVIGILVGILAPSPGHILTRLLWYDPEDPALNLHAPPAPGAPLDERMPRRSRGVPLFISVSVLSVSLLFLALFIGYTGNDQAVNLQLSVVAFVLVFVRLLAWPAISGLFVAWLVASSRRSRAFDWFIWLFPMTITAHTAVV